MSVEQTVRNWVTAWEEQALDNYFSSYHPDFEPRYHRNRNAWHDNRQRVIGGASRISLELTDFVIVSEDADLIEVHFWLAYQSPTYRDDTRKKLILRKQVAPDQSDGTTETEIRWLILEEINLEVRA